MSNILPKKSWNVYNEKNKEKIRKDELEARIEADLKADKAQDAERESRLNILRQRANAHSDYLIEPESSDSNININQVERFTLFEEAKASEKDSQKIQSKSRNISIHEQHTLDDPMAMSLFKNNTVSQIKFAQNRNSLTSKQIINKSCPEARKKLREERERVREEELLKKRNVGQ